MIAGRCSEVLQKGFCYCIKDTQHRSTGVIARGKEIALCCRVVPDLVLSANLRNYFDRSVGAVGRVEDHRTASIAAADDQIAARTRGQSRRTAYSART